MNFKELDDLIRSGVKEIVLDQSVVLAGGEESEYLNGIELKVDDLIIDGNGHTIDAQGKTRIFYCAGKNITIKNITLKNGHAYDGGAIANVGDLNISNSTFNKNTSDYGGAILNQGRMELINSSLSHNYAKNESGAIDNKYGGKLTIVESIFQENISKLHGGAIANIYDLSIKGTAFNENASDHGGAIANVGRLSISNSIFNGNLSNLGGAINLKKSYESDYELDNCTFKDNKPDDVYEEK